MNDISSALLHIRCKLARIEGLLDGSLGMLAQRLGQIDKTLKGGTMGKRAKKKTKKTKK